MKSVGNGNFLNYILISAETIPNFPIPMGIPLSQNPTLVHISAFHSHSHGNPTGIPSSRGVPFPRTSPFTAPSAELINCGHACSPYFDRLRPFARICPPPRSTPPPRHCRCCGTPNTALSVSAPPEMQSATELLDADRCPMPERSNCRRAALAALHRPSMEAW